MGRKGPYSLEFKQDEKGYAKADRALVYPLSEASSAPFWKLRHKKSLLGIPNIGDKAEQRSKGDFYQVFEK
jgi:hypothetical protein